MNTILIQQPFSTFRIVLNTRTPEHLNTMSNQPDPSSIMRLATGYWNSATLLAANELNLFGALGELELTARQVADHLQTPLRSTEMLLDACAGLDLLRKQEQDGAYMYANTPAAAAFLVPDRPGYLGNAIRWGAGQYEAWGKLEQAVRADAPVVPPADHLGSDTEQTRRFVLGMHNRALGVARGVLHFLDFADTTRLLDVGGGPGTYAMLLAQKYPVLRVTVLDLPGVTAIAQELITRSGFSDRVQTLAGSAIEAEWGVAEYDGLLFSGVLHQMSGETIRKLFAKAHQALQPGGKLVVSDIMLDATKTQPAFATLFSLQMLLTSEQGAVFSAAECINWLEQAGFASVQAQALPPPLPYVVVTGRK